MMTRQELFDAMLTGEQVTLHHTESLPGIGGVRHCTTIGRVNVIALEDGSGYNFNVTLALNKEAGYGKKTVFVRCPRPTLVHKNHDNHQNSKFKYTLEPARR